jgi:hypothetical protein
MTFYRSLPPLTPAAMASIIQDLIRAASAVPSIITGTQAEIRIQHCAYIGTCPEVTLIVQQAGIVEQWPDGRHESWT